MALGGTQQSAPQIAPINPANLIGQADPNIVEPRAVGILTDAFHKGVISAEDITARIGEVGQAKKKAELDMANAASMQATEAQSPEAIAARQQQLATATAQGQLGQAQAERAKVIAQYPAVEYFDKLAAKAGIAEPKLPDGTPDYKEMEKIGLELALNTSEKLAAQQELDNIVTKETNDGNVISAFTKQGAPVDSAYVAKLRSKATKPFVRQTPGTVEVAPEATVVAPVVEARGVAAAPLEDLNTVRARLAETFGSAEAVVGMDEAELRRSDALAKPPMVTPRGATVAATGVIPTGTPVSGGYSLGNTPKPVAGVKTSTAEQDKANLALSRFAESKIIQDALAAKQYDPTTYTAELNRLMPQIFKSGDQKLYETAQQAWAQGLLRLESGAAISPREQAWYSQTFFPAVKDTPEVVQAKAGLRANVERTMAEIAQKGGVISPEAVRNAALIAQPRAASATGSAAGNELPLPSGKTLVRDANGVYSYK